MISITSDQIALLSVDNVPAPGAPGLAVYRFQNALHGIDSFRRRREQHRNGEQDVECRGEGGAHEQSPWQCLAGVANLVADVRGNLETEQRETEEAENRNQMPVDPGGSPDEPCDRHPGAQSQPSSEPRPE